MEGIAMPNDFEKDLMDHARKVTARPVYVFTVPAEEVQEIGVSRMGFVKLTGNEVNNATQRCRNNMVRLSFELALESLRKVDDVKVSTADGTADRVWDKMGMKGWSFAIAAYGKLHTPEESRMESFLGSMVVEAG
jgi:hypothetical protein